MKTPPPHQKKKTMIYFNLVVIMYGGDFSTTTNIYYTTAKWIVQVFSFGAVRAAVNTLRGRYLHRQVRVEDGECCR